MSTKKITNRSFAEITGHELSNTSILNLFNIMEDSDKIKFLNIFKPYMINTDILADTLYYLTYEVEDIDWYDQIAYNIYNDEYLWWIVAMTNNVINPFEELDSSLNLKVLKEQFVPMIIREIKAIAEK